MTINQPPYFYTFNQYLKETYPWKVYKIPIDAGFTCPNRDGTKAIGGCTYCDNISFSPGARTGGLPYELQIQKGINFYREKRKAKKFIIYFQAYSNTYADINHLKSLYDTALQIPDVLGLSIGTRPDCIDEEKLELLSSYKKQGYYVLVEYGLESSNNKTLEAINRQHTVEDFINAVELTHKYGLDICCHTILGLPEDTYETMMETAQLLASLNIRACKIHHLYIAPHTVMEEQYNHHKIKVMDIEEYIRIACDFMELLPPETVIHRFIGELYGEHCIAPNWKMTKAQVLERFAQEFIKRDSHQGSRYQKRLIFTPATSITNK
jgi:radical SAM protein (TIGR01212 family)